VIKIRSGDFGLSNIRGGVGESRGSVDRLDKISAGGSACRRTSLMVLGVRSLWTAGLWSLGGGLRMWAWDR